jgi:hypothetical protein
MERSTDEAIVSNRSSRVKGSMSPGTFYERRKPNDAPSRLPRTPTQQQVERCAVDRLRAA